MFDKLLNLERSKHTLLIVIVIQHSKSFRMLRLGPIRAEGVTCPIKTQHKHSLESGR